MSKSFLDAVTDKEEDTIEIEQPGTERLMNYFLCWIVVATKVVIK